MTTIVNNPGGGSNDSGAGLIIGVIVALVIIVLFFVYALPALRGSSAPAQPGIHINVTPPTGGAPAAGGSGSTQ